LREAEGIISNYCKCGWLVCRSGERTDFPVLAGP
jgi:hypothetical protein